MNEFQLEAKVTQQIAIETNIEKLDMFLEVVKDKYANRLVTEDDLTNSKKDRATLNKIVAQLKKAKKDVETDGKKNINEFLKKIDEAVKEISEISNNIDDQVKAYEAVEKEKKLKLAEATRIKILVEMNINEDIREFIKLDSKVTNKTYTMTKIEDDLKIKASAIQDKYNFVMKEINKNNAGLTNKIFFDDVKSIFDTDLTNIVSRVETTANLRRTQEEKVKREAEEKAKKENEKAIEEAREEERKKLNQNIKAHENPETFRKTDDIEKNENMNKDNPYQINTPEKEKLKQIAIKNLEKNGSYTIVDLRAEYKKLYEEKYGEILESPEDIPEEIKESPVTEEKKENIVLEKVSSENKKLEIIGLNSDECRLFAYEDEIELHNHIYECIDSFDDYENANRWTYFRYKSFKRDDGKKFQFYYQVGLTEMQENIIDFEKSIQEYIEPEKHAYITIQVDGLSKDVTDELLALLEKHELNYEYEER